MPMTSVDIRFKVLQLLDADTYGETYRIIIGKKRSDGLLQGDMRENLSRKKGSFSDISEEEKEGDEDGKDKN